MLTQSLNCSGTSGRKNELILPPPASSQESQRTAQGSMENGEAAVVVTLFEAFRQEYFLLMALIGNEMTISSFSQASSTFVFPFSKKTIFKGI